MTLEVDTLPSAKEFIQSGIDRVRRSNWSLLFLAGLISNSCIDISGKFEDLPSDPGQAVYILTDTALTLGTALSLQSPDGRRRITLSKEEQTGFSLSMHVQEAAPVLEPQDSQTPLTVGQAAHL